MQTEIDLAYDHLAYDTSLRIPESSLSDYANMRKRTISRYSSYSSDFYDLGPP